MNWGNVIIFGEVLVTVGLAIIAFHWSQTKRVQSREGRLLSLENKADRHKERMALLEENVEDIHEKLDKGLVCLNNLDKQMAVVNYRLDANGFKKS